jgi:hypothetical protein
MTPCHIEITGVSGMLEVFGCGTALFIASDSNGDPVILRVHNCLFSYGEFNLLSVSQLNQVNSNGVDFSRHLSCMTLHTAGKWRRQTQIPLLLDDGLYGIRMESIQTDDPSYHQYHKCDVTPAGDFVMCEDDHPDSWHARILAFASPSAMILVAPTTYFASNLESICEGYLAPPSIPAARRMTV